MMELMSLPNTTPTRRKLQQLGGGRAHARGLAPGEHPAGLDGHQQHAPDGALDARQLEGRPQPVGRRPVPGRSLALEPAGQVAGGPAQPEHRLLDGQHPDLLVLGQHDHGHAGRGRGAGRRSSTADIPTLFPADIKQQGGAGQPAALWGSLGPYSDGTLWNQAPWLNNQDLFVVKDDWSAVFGKHFVKAGIPAQHNEKNEEPANTSQESVQVNGAVGFLGPNGYLPGVDHRQRDRELAAQWDGLEHRRDPDQQERPAALERLRVLHRRHLQGQPPRDRRLRRPPEPPHPAVRRGRPDGVVRPRGRRPRRRATHPATACCIVPGHEPMPRAGPGGRTGRSQPLAPAHEVDPLRAAARRGLGRLRHRARRRSAAAWASSTPASGSARVWPWARTHRSRERARSPGRSTPTSVVSGAVRSSFGAPTAGIIQEAGNAQQLAVEPRGPARAGAQHGPGAGLRRQQGPRRSSAVPT